MAEWSKATDSRSVISGCAGSNAAGVTKLASIAQLAERSTVILNWYEIERSLVRNQLGE